MPEELMPMNTMIHESVCCSPCLVLGGFDAVLVRAFRRSGWDVYPARTGPEARRLARMVEADLVVLDTQVAEESGWLTCEKLTSEVPGVRVILVDRNPDPHGEDLAEFVGAAVLIDRENLEELARRDPAEVLSAAR
jgi:CheY-like chemotaxis protein